MGRVVRAALAAALALIAVAALAQPAVARFTVSPTKIDIERKPGGTASGAFDVVLKGERADFEIQIQDVVQQPDGTFAFEQPSNSPFSASSWVSVTPAAVLGRTRPDPARAVHGPGPAEGGARRPHHLADRDPGPVAVQRDRAGRTGGLRSAHGPGVRQGASGRQDRLARRAGGIRQLTRRSLDRGGEHGQRHARVRRGGLGDSGDPLGGRAQGEHGFHGRSVSGPEPRVRALLGRPFDRSVPRRGIRRYRARRRLRFAIGAPAPLAPARRPDSGRRWRRWC